MTPLDSLGSLVETLKPLLELGHVVRIEPGPGSRSERFTQTLSPASHPTELKPQPVRPSTVNLPPVVPPPLAEPAPAGPLPLADSSAGAHGAPGARGAPIDQRVVELEAAVAKLRRQLDHLAWKLGEQLKG
jgi:uncharacterized protein YceH (UPF0502 family)